MSNLIIPTSQKDLEALRGAMTEISNSMIRIDSEKDHIKEVLGDLEDKFELPKKFLRKVAVAYHKQNISDTMGEANDVEELYEAVFNDG